MKTSFALLKEQNIDFHGRGNSIVKNKYYYIPETPKVNLHPLLCKNLLGNHMKLSSGNNLIQISLVIQCLRLHTPNIGELGSILGQRTRSFMTLLRVYMLQLRILMSQIKMLHATTKTQDSQINKY